MSGRLFRALLHVVSTEDGGRHSPFVAGYRPQFVAPGAVCQTSFMIEEIEGAKEMRPGQTGRVRASLLVPEGLGVDVPEGLKFELREGDKVIATGVVELYL